VLGVAPGVSAEELHDAYRRLVKIHHPDRNGGSAESTRRFQEIQAAYSTLRDRGHAAPPPRTPHPPPREPVDTRMADIERELREARAAQERARRAAREAVGDFGAADSGRVETDDSFGAIFSDLRDEVSARVADARKHPAVKRVSDLLDGLDDLSSRFDDRKKR
jgi:curved DNA-binding protein CbpA